MNIPLQVIQHPHQATHSIVFLVHVLFMHIKKSEKGRFWK